MGLKQALIKKKLPQLKKFPLSSSRTLTKSQTSQRPLTRHPKLKPALIKKKLPLLKKLLLSSLRALKKSQTSQRSLTRRPRLKPVLTTKNKETAPVEEIAPVLENSDKVPDLT